MLGNVTTKRAQGRSVSHSVSSAMRYATTLYGRDFQFGRGFLLRHFLMQKPLRGLRPEKCTIRIADGYLIELDLDGYIANQLYWFGNFEDEVKSYLVGYLRPGAVCVDVGAHVGYFTLIMSSLVGPQGRVFSFEPEPRNFGRLCSNLQLNSVTNVEPVCAALSDFDGIARLWLSRDANDGMHSLLDWGLSSHHTQVRTMKLDTFALGRRLDQRIDLVKLDCEGSETEALDGMQETILRFKPVLLVEVHPTYLLRRGRGVEQFKSCISSAGYHGFKVRRDGSLVPCQATTSEHSHNMVFLPEQVPDNSAGVEAMADGTT